MIPRLLALCASLALALSLASLSHAAATATPAAKPLLDKNNNPEGFKTLAIGDAAPDFSLPGIDGKTYSLRDFAGPDVLMVLFTSNHCPTSHGIEKRLQKLRDDFRHQSFALVAINPNHPDGLSLDELGYGEFNDSFEEMKPYAESNGWDFPYLYDGDKQLTARAYGCLATPHVFIFDKQRKLRYAGRFDDSRFPQEDTVKSPDARNAVTALLAGKPVPVELTKPHGCSTKWREKRAKHQAWEASWKDLPVTIEGIDNEGIAALRKNPTNKFRLINVWATWCAPCVEEFPDLIMLSRRFNMRPFELITLSMDDERAEPRAKAFLEKQGAGLTKHVTDRLKPEGRTTNHYRYTGGSQDEVVAALDSQWPGPIPHTILVAPGGEIVWRHNGVIDPEAALKAIVEAMTPYYQPQPKPATVAISK
ncbi:MAG TPA: redoxin domain-containing protein [Opitutaceae bacterium]|nr:redoxin domain-containing protein [Opitutaceae bacterium]